MRGAVLTICSCLLLVTVCRAQVPADDQETIRSLAQQVKDLQARISALEAQQVPKPTPHDDSSADSLPLQQQPEVDTDGARTEAPLGIQWKGFGEVNYKLLNQRVPELGTFGFVPGSAGNFFTGDFDLLLTSRISEKAGLLSEVVIGEGDAQSFDVDLERILFKYDYNDHFRISIGRYHTGIGYYNTAFHSGKWLQTTADRPLIMEFANDGGLLPTQAVGVTLTGTIPSGRLGLNYLAEYGSSDTIRPELNSAEPIEEDENNGNHVNVGLFIRPEALRGLQLGGSFYHDEISDFQRGPTVRLGQTIVNAHLIYDNHGYELLNEGFLIRHAYKNGGPIYNMPAFYSQVSKKFGKVRPYVRYQYINANVQSIFEDVSLRQGPSLGARYDFNEGVAGKAQLDHTMRTGQPDLNGLQLQLAFSF